MTLKDYLERVAQIYKKYIPDYLEELQDYNKLNNELSDTRASVKLTPDGKQEATGIIQEKMRRSREKMEKIQQAAEQEAMKVRQIVEEKFNDRFHPTPECLDMQGLELLKSGILSDSELMALAAKYNGNMTMQRICGKYMEERNNSELKQTGRLLQAKGQDQHLRCVDGVITWGNYCMGRAPLSGFAGVDCFVRKFDEQVAQIYAAAPDIEA